MTYQCNGDDEVNKFYRSGAQYNASLQISKFMCLKMGSSLIIYILCEYVRASSALPAAVSHVSQFSSNYPKASIQACTH